MKQLRYYLIYLAITTAQLLLWRVTGNSIGLFFAGCVVGAATMVTVVIVAEKKGWV